MLRLVTDKFQCVLPTAGKIAVHFVFNGGYLRFRYPAKLGSMAFQIHSHCGFTYASPYKRGWSYNRSAASLALPPLEIARRSFPLADPGLPSIDNLHGRPLAVPGWEIIHLGYRVILDHYRDILNTQRSGRANVEPANSGTARTSCMSRRVNPMEPAPIMAILRGMEEEGRALRGSPA